MKDQYLRSTARKAATMGLIVLSFGLLNLVIGFFAITQEKPNVACDCFGMFFACCSTFCASVSFELVVAKSSALFVGVSSGLYVTLMGFSHFAKNFFHYFS